ncbi:MAG: TerC family protein [Burkholderiales bacterium]|uniref:TerC family protein n=1 Tax=Inhella sp. TaxID=1921806 RepID=UPI001AD2EC0C|nr:TerC family protein [Burkholderiales bacterium]
MDWLSDPNFWLAVGQIIMIDVLLGGDNAVVIALACRRLPADLRRRGILWGTAGAIGLRVMLIFFAITLLKLPALKLVGALLLVWIGVKLLLPEDDDTHGNIQASDKLLAAIKTIIVADFVMSLDNVIGIAGAAETASPDHQMSLVVFGLLVSIPIIVWGSQLVIRLMDRFPFIITAGAMLLGWIAGTLTVGDPLLQPYLEPSRLLSWGAGAAGAVLVWVLGLWFQRRALAAKAAAVE